MFKWLIYSYTLVKGYNKGNHGLGHKWIGFVEHGVLSLTVLYYGARPCA